MGAEQFDHFISDEKSGGDVNKARELATEEAAWDYGHAGYTGTMAEKDSHVIIGEPMSWEDAQNTAEKLMRDCDPRIDDKWGPAGAIRVVDTDNDNDWYFFGWASS